MSAFTRPEKPSRLGRQDSSELADHRMWARMQATTLHHKLSHFLPYRIVNGHTTTVAVCEKCGSEVTIVLRPADGSYPVQGAAVTDRCQK